MFRINNINFIYVLLLIMLSLILTGCTGGGSSSSNSGTTSQINPIHTEFKIYPADIYDAGIAYSCTSIVWETRGDPINIIFMKTWRTWGGKWDNNPTDIFYSGSPVAVQGWMFDKATANPVLDGYDIKFAIISDTSNIVNRRFDVFQPYESRTFSTTVMVGRPYQRKPDNFNGIWITNSKYKEWKSRNIPGIKLWIKLEGYDYRQSQEYNIYIPLVINFIYNPFTSEASSNEPSSSSNNPTNSNPYSDPYNPYSSMKINCK